MPDASGSISITMQDATGSVAVRSYADLLIIGEDGSKTKSFQPKGIDTMTGTDTLTTIQGISQFDGLTDGGKNLVFTLIGSTMTWDGGTAVPVVANTEYLLYGADDNNFIIIKTHAAALPIADKTDVITISDDIDQNGQVTVIELEDELTAAILLKDANGATVDELGTYPRPAATKYAILDTDKSLVAINNTVGSTDISVNYSVYNDPRAYTSQNAVEADHLAGTEIAKTSAKMFANGAGTVSVINVNDAGTPEYALGLTMLQTKDWDYDIMAITVDVDDADFVLCAAHAVTYMKTIVAPKIGTAAVAIASWTTLTSDEGQCGLCYDTSVYSVGELSGAVAAAIAQKKPWIPIEWAPISGINPSGYSKDDLVTIEGDSASIGGSTIIQAGTSTVLSSGRGIKAGTFIDIPRTKLYLKNAVIDAWVSAKLRIAGAGDKIPYTQGGITRIESIIRKPLKNAQKAGALREDSYDSLGVLQPGFVIKMPLMENISAAYISARQLPDVEITAYLSGAISTINPLYFTISLGEV
jgi:hypothetical protein